MSNYDAWQAKWLDKVFAGGTLALTYSNGTSKTYTIRELLDIPNLYGLWGRLDIWPVSRAGIRIADLDTKDGFIGSNTDPSDNDPAGYPPAIVAEYADYAKLYAGNHEGYGDGGWAEWAELANPRMRFTYRGVTLDESVPVYNRPVSIAAVARGGENPVVMNGKDYVYNQPVGMDYFLGRVKVSVTYRRGSNAEDLKTRDDVVADLNAGTIRSIAVPLEGDKVSGAKTLTPKTTVPVIRAGNVYIWDTNYPPTWINKNNTTGAAGTGDVWRARNYGEDGNYTLPTASILTASNSSRYDSTGRTQAARIEFVGYGGRPGTTRPLTDRTILVGVTGYTYDVPEWEDS